MDFETLAIAKKSTKKAEAAQKACEDAVQECAAYVGNTKVTVCVDETDGHVVFNYMDNKE